MASIRLMRESEFREALQLWKELGFAEGTYILHTFHRVDPNGLYVAIGDDGELIGTCGMIAHNDDLACVGLYGVRPSHQGKGIGLKLWNKAMEHVGDRNCFLNAVPDHLHTYRDRAGFNHVSEHHSIVWENTVIDIKHLAENVPGITIKPITDDMVGRITDYDAEVAGYRRPVMVSAMLKEKDIVSLAALRGEKMCGFGCLKDNIISTTMMSPLYADTPEIAELLVRNLLEAFPSGVERGVTMFGIDANSHSANLAVKLGLKKMDTVARVHTKRVVHANYAKVYAQMCLNFCTI